MKPKSSKNTLCQLVVSNHLLAIPYTGVWILNRHKVVVLPCKQEFSQEGINDSLGDCCCFMEGVRLTINDRKHQIVVNNAINHIDPGQPKHSTSL